MTPEEILNDIKITDGMKIEFLQRLGYDLEEILQMALTVKLEQQAKETK